APGDQGGFLALLRQDSGLPGNTPGTPVPSAANTIAIDAGGLAPGGAGPYLLDQSGTTYVLGTDVRTEGTAFVVAAPDVTLDLNGHQGVYGHNPPPRPPHGG